MARKPGQLPEVELPPIEIDASVDERMEIVGLTDESATPVPRPGSGVRPVRPASPRVDTSPVPTAPVGTEKVDVSDDVLDSAQLQTVEAIRHSVETCAQVLRIVAQLCLEKRVFVPAEMRRKTS
jgi:hypothetical protein